MLPRHARLRMERQPGDHLFGIVLPVTGDHQALRAASGHPVSPRSARTQALAATTRFSPLRLAARRPEHPWHHQHLRRNLGDRVRHQAAQAGYPDVGGPVFIYEDFRDILSTNPRPASG
ncbi:MAG TPA: hypothetical protein DHU96_05900 [Actinobacteria bacterium]|nr:hypothetical protein [Actinomycetota bacterium]